MIRILLTFKFHAMNKFLTKIKTKDPHFKKEKKTIVWKYNAFLRLTLKFVNKNICIQLSPKNSNCTVKFNFFNT